jgi:hypothetical protein
MKRLLPILLIVWLVCCGFTQGWQKPPLGTQANKAHPMAQKLVLALVMNEASGKFVYDYSGNNKHGRLTNATWRGSSLGSVLDFADNEYIVIPAIADNATLNAGWTCHMIVSGDAWPVAFGGPVISIGANYNDSSLRWSLASHSNVLRNYCRDAFGASIPVVTNRWYAITVTYQGPTTSALLKLYFDGKLKDNTGYADIHAENNLYIGSGYNGYHDGQFSTVYFWTRVLNPTEVSQLYNWPYAMFTTPIMSRPYLNFGQSGEPPAVTPMKRRTMIQISWWEQMMKNLGIG